MSVTAAAKASCSKSRRYCVVESGFKLSTDSKARAQKCFLIPPKTLTFHNVPAHVITFYKAFPIYPKWKQQQLYYTAEINTYSGRYVSITH